MAIKIRRPPSWKINTFQTPQTYCLENDQKRRRLGKAPLGDSNRHARRGVVHHLHAVRLTTTSYVVYTNLTRSSVEF